MGRLAKTHSQLQSFDELCRQAFSSGLHPWEFYEYTIKEYGLLQEGRFDARRVELKQEFQHVRFLAFHFLLPYLSKANQKKSIDELIPNIYEKEVKTGKANEDYNKIIERYKKAGYL